MILMSFISWLAKRLVNGVINTYTNYRELLEDDHLLGVLLTLLVTGVISVCAAGAGGIIGGEIWACLCLISSLVLCITLYVWTSISVLYNKFLSERRQLFDTIKNSNHN